MTMPSEPLRVLVACGVPRAWDQVFASSGIELVQADDTARPDVLLGDADWRERVTAELGQDVALRSVGLIGLGLVSSAEVQLPSDAPDREIVLACRLLGDVVRLRRRLETSQQQVDVLATETLTDPLTGIANRRAWDRWLETTAVEILGRGGILCLAIVDLDHFKQINDTHGHAIGDAVLKAAAASLRSGMRQGDLVARLGGDEFALALHRIDEADAPRVLNRLDQRLAATGAEAQLPDFTASIGFACSADERDPTVATLIEGADRAMHRAKHEGRNRVVANGR